MEQRNIKIGTHGEQYGNWMSAPVFYMLGGVIAVAALLAFLFFKVLHFPVLGVIFLIILIAVAAATCWFAWIRKQYSFGGGGIMDRVHQVLLSQLDFDGQGTPTNWTSLTSHSMLLSATMSTITSPMRRISMTSLGKASGY